MRKMESDIFVPVLNLAIEYDGAYWHEKASAKDKRKNTFVRLTASNWFASDRDLWKKS